MREITTLDRKRLAEHRLLNRLQTFLLLAVMLLLLGLSAHLLFGSGALFGVLLGIGLLLILAPKISPHWVLRLYQAQPLTPIQAPSLNAALRELAARAQLPATPALYYIPSRVINAFAVGNREQAAIAVTDGLLRILTLRELVGVLAHEVSHVCHNDMRVMALADMVSRITSNVSLAGQLLLLLSLPAFLLTDLEIPWLGLLLLIFAPSVSALLQLALSRTREFDADLGALRLTGDPQGLASALAKLEQSQGGLLERVLLPGRHNPDPSLLRSHPATEERIQRLLSLSHRWTSPREPVVTTDLDSGRLFGDLPNITRRPRHHLFGLWH